MIAFSVQVHIGDITTTIADGFLGNKGIDLQTQAGRDLIASIVTLWAAELAESASD